MFKKVNNSIFVILFLLTFFVPLLFTKWESGGVAETENRNLAKFPSLVSNGSFNLSFTTDFETWFMDHMGFRQNLIDANKTFQKDVFDRAISKSDYKTGKTGDSIYATNVIIKDYAHVNLRTEEEVAQIGQSYQKISDWLDAKGVPFYYVQCVDKHTTYPERFIASVKQIGTVSKTDQVIDYLQNHTTVNTIYFKQLFADLRTQYDIFSHWGDPTHWTSRGAYMGYRHMMERINRDMEQPLTILDEEDYEITLEVQEGPDGQSEQIEKFNIRDAKAQQVNISAMGEWAEDHRHSIWKNSDAGNDKRLLLMGDSYFNSYLVDDIAESFGEVWLVWGEYTNDLPEIVELCKPDVVIYECAERVDRSESVCNLAESLQNAG